MSNMQIKERSNTFLPESLSFAILDQDDTCLAFSRGLEETAASLGMQTATLASLLSRTEPGTWPVRIGGILLESSASGIDSGRKLVILQTTTKERIAKLLESSTGEELFTLCGSDGRILTASGGAAELFGDAERITGLFDSSSSGAITAAMKKCCLEGRIPEFLVSHTDDRGRKANYGLSMRRLSGPGKLILCTMRVPSVAVVTGTVDRNSMIRTLLEESFCPNVTIDSAGTIVSMNSIARRMSIDLWGKDPTGNRFFDLVHPDQREAVINRHEQRQKGLAVPSRYTIELSGRGKSGISAIDVSIVPLQGLERLVVFINPVNGDTAGDNEEVLPEGFRRLLEQDSISPEEVLLELLSFTRASAAAYVTEGGIITSGDSRALMRSIERNELAASSGGFIQEKIYHHRINTVFGVSHILLQMQVRKEPDEGCTKVLRVASRILESHHTESILSHERKLLALVREIADSYLGRKESVDGLLSDFSRIASMETAVIYRISSRGSYLRSIAGAGTVGPVQDLPLEELSTASWACLRGETAFYTCNPGEDLRFSRVFGESLSEIAVPFFRGTTPDGVILMASSERDYITSSSADFISLLALLFSSRENAYEQGNGARENEDSLQLRDMTLENLIHGLSGINAAFAARMDILTRDIDRESHSLRSMKELLETARLLEFHGKWALWFLRTSLYEGKPRQRWIDPVPLLEKTMAELDRLGTAENMKLVFNPPGTDMEVCTDGAFVSMIAHSLIACVIDNTTDCSSLELSLDSGQDHWTITLETRGDSVPGECLTTDRQPDSRNMAFILAWKLTDDLGGTLSTFSNRGRSTRIVVRLRISG